MRIGRIIWLYRLRYLGEEANSLKKIRYTQRRIKIANLGDVTQASSNTKDCIHCESEDCALQSSRRRKMKQLFVKSQSLFQQSRKSTQLPFHQDLNREQVRRQTHQGLFNHCCVSRYFKITQFEYFIWG